MAITVTPQAITPDGGVAPVQLGAAGGLSMGVANVVGSGTDYTTGGYVITPAQLGLFDAVKFADAVIVVLGASNNTGVIAVPKVQANGNVLLQLFTSAGVELANAVNTSGITYQLQYYGY